MAVTASAREHLFEAISRQYESEDAETLKALLMSTNTEDLATKQDLAAFATKQDLAAFATKHDLAAFATKQDLAAFATKQDFAEFKLEFKAELYQQTRTYVSWMFGLLTAYTATVGSAVAVAAVVIH